MKRMRWLVDAGADRVAAKDAWRVRAVNGMSLLFAGVAAVHAIAFVATGQLLPAVVGVYGVITHLSAPFLASRGRQLAARLSLVLAPVLAVVALSILLGSSSRFAVLLYVYPGAALLAFSRARPWLRGAMVLAPLLARGLIELVWAQDWAPPGDPQLAAVVLAVTPWTVAAVAVAMALIFRAHVEEERARAVASHQETVAASVRLREQTEELEEAERSRAAAAAKLSAISHRAGMARAASEVLHNAGNALNGVGASTAACAEALATLRVDGLKKGAALCRQLGEGDPRAPKLIDYLDALEAGRVASLERVDAELESLAGSCAHIHSIVHRQLETSAAGESQRVDMAQLVEHAIGIAGKRAAGLVIDRRFSVAPGLVSCDADRLVEVIVNLLRNAAEAMAELGRDRVNLELTAAAKGVSVVLEDDGPGVPQAMRARIFEGFSSKEEGHGFGLASCARALKQMGGALLCVDPQELRGARFELFVPVD